MHSLRSNDSTVLSVETNGYRTPINSPNNCGPDKIKTTNTSAKQAAKPRTPVGIPSLSSVEFKSSYSEIAVVVEVVVVVVVEGVEGVIADIDEVFNCVGICEFEFQFSILLGWLKKELQSI